MRSGGLPILAIDLIQQLFQVTVHIIEVVVCFISKPAADFNPVSVFVHKFHYVEGIGTDVCVGRAIVEIPICLFIGNISQLLIRQRANRQIDQIFIPSVIRRILKLGVKILIATAPPLLSNPFSVRFSLVRRVKSTVSSTAFGISRESICRIHNGTA